MNAIKPLALVTLALTLVLPAAARAATGEIGVDAAAVRLEGDVEPALRLRGNVRLLDSLSFESQILRTLSSDGTLTSVMVGPSVELPIAWCCEGDGEDTAFWTFTALAGAGRAESHGASETGLAWQGGVGARWKLDAGVNLRVEAGWQGANVGDSADGPFVATGIAWRLGD